MFGEDLFSAFTAEPTGTFESSDLNSDSKNIDAENMNMNMKRVSDIIDDEVLQKKLKTDDINLNEIMPRIQVHRLETLEICTHEVAVPPGVQYVPLVVSKSAAKEYPFILDPFQKEALLCLDNGQSVLVSAHTSAGKTVVAEYAIAISLRDKQRVIYTTPIKALSNQKYRELFEEFRDVGLMTGDITINPTASCLVMTTEILRSMLYRGSEIMREVGWVIFDEIHYMRDKERGVVWEETIILLPDNVHHVFLSATIPNARQFAEWISFLHKQPCHVVYTDYRPTPLQHYIFPAGGDGIHLVVDEQGAFREDNFAAAMNVLRDSGDASKGDKWGRKGGFKGETNCFKIIKMIMERNFAPVIVFSFSRKECEAYARQTAKLDFSTDDEKKMITTVFNNAIDSLSDEDKGLPQVESILPLLLKGIGIHHSGLLPLLKETIEILFSEGLIKTLFATETFAMGLNMPAKTVLFTSARKFDGKENRWISSGEYIQMSGRAGRRGLDDKGIVILMVDEKLSPNIGKQILKGQPDPLNSAFHLTYNMVLNLMRVEEINPEYMLERSFFQFQNYASIPALVEKIQKLEEEHRLISIEDEDKVRSYFKLQQQLAKLRNDGLAYLQKPQYILPFLQPGRLVKVKNEDLEFGWGVVVNFRRKANQNKTSNGLSENCQYIVDTLLHLTKESAKLTNANSIQPSPKNERGEMLVVPVKLENLVQFSSVRVYMPKDIVSTDSRMTVLSSVQAVEKRFPDGLPLLDPIEDIGIKDKNFIELIKRTLLLEERQFSHAMHKDPNSEPLFARYLEKQKILIQLQDLKSELKKKKSLLQMDELRRRKRILRRLGYATVADVIETKGRVACEISSADELVVTEMIFNGAFNKITAEETCALLSCFAFGEKTSEMPKLSSSLSDLLTQMQDTVKRIARVSNEAKLDIIEEDYLAQFTPTMMDVVHTWCLGSSFAHICKMTTIFEGSIIRCMRRLEEMLRQMCQAAKTIGNTDLENKFAEGIKLIKRDIVFAASLYL